MRMNEKEFWEFIELIKINKGSHSSDIRCALRELDYEQLIDFTLHLENILDILENSNNALAFAKVLTGDYLGDDGWLYFKSWLIYQGKDIVFKAMINPDSLADIYKSAPKETEDYLSLFLNIFDYVFEDMDEDEIEEMIAESKWKDIWDNTKKIDRSDYYNIWKDIEKTKIYGQVTFSNDEELDYELIDSDAYLKKQMPKLWDKFSKN